MPSNRHNISYECILPPSPHNNYHQSLSMQAPRLISSHTYLSRVSDSLTCVKNTTLTFNVNTSVPIVEVPTKLNNIISFDLQELNTALKFGRWMDYRTLTIVFVECVVWNKTTTSGKQRPISVIFEASRGL